MDVEDLNSSDIDFGEPASNNPTGRCFGQASIELIVQHAAEYRLASKKTVKQLQFGHGPPRTRQQQSVWTTRFEAFRIHALSQSLDTSFTGEDLIRFFDTIIGIVRPIGNAIYAQMRAV
jgi:hypothetical protein